MPMKAVERGMFAQSQISGSHVGNSMDTSAGNWLYWLSLIIGPTDNWLAVGSGVVC